MFCGGSLITKSGFRLDNTRLANWEAVKILEIAKILGRI